VISVFFKSYVKKKYQLLIPLLIVLLIFFWYGIASFISGIDLQSASTNDDMTIIYSLHPFLPFSRMFRALLGVQNLNSDIGFQEIVYVMVLGISSFGIIEVLLLLVFLYIVGKIIIQKRFELVLSLYLIGFYLIVIIFKYSIGGFLVYNNMYTTNTNVDLFQQLSILSIICGILTIIVVGLAAVLTFFHIAREIDIESQQL